jgi:gluconokinase
VYEFTLANCRNLAKVALSQAVSNAEYCHCPQSKPSYRFGNTNNNMGVACAEECTHSFRDSATPLEVPMVSPLSALVVMGVSGCGKSSVGAAIVEHSGGRLIEGDAFHPPANIEKMSAGIPLNDDDRAGWLQRLGEEMATWVAKGERPVLTCSALRRRYRDTLRQAVPELGFVFLDLTREEAAYRVSHRPGHFMPASLIDSQFATLESPVGEAFTLAVDAAEPIEQLALRVDGWLRENGAADLSQAERVTAGTPLCAINNHNTRP